MTTDTQHGSANGHGVRPRCNIARKLAVAHGLSEKTVIRAGKYAAAIDRILSVLGPDIVTAILTRKVRTKAAEVHQLAGLPDDRMKTVWERVQAGERLSAALASVAGVEPKKPADPLANAQRAYNKLSAIEAFVFREWLEDQDE